jgi:hypothetical protein
MLSFHIFHERNNHCIVRDVSFTHIMHVSCDLDDSPRCNTKLIIVV